VKILVEFMMNISLLSLLPFSFHILFGASRGQAEKLETILQQVSNNFHSTKIIKLKP